MKAKLVIITGRNRSRAPAIADVEDRLSLPPLIHGELDDEYAVLRRERDQHHQPDLRIDVETAARDHDRRNGAENADADRQENGNGNVPALVESHEKEVGEQDREAKHDDAPPAAAFSWRAVPVHS